MNCFFSGSVTNTHCQPWCSSRSALQRDVEHSPSTAALDGSLEVERLRTDPFGMSSSWA